MAKSLITGGAGFIGSHLADLLVAEGDEVIIVDNLSTGGRHNLNPEARFFELDIRDPRLEELFAREKPDFVYHLAAQIDVRKSVEDPAEDARINLLGSLNLLESAARNATRKVIFASTGGAIYGETEQMPTPETHYEQPLSPYGIHKLAVEKSLFFYREVKGLDYTVLRMSNVYGPRQNSNGEAGVVAIFMSKFLEGETPLITGDGSQTRDYVFVKDVARAFLLARQKTPSDRFNISTGVETSVNEIFDRVAAHLGIDNGKKYQAAKQGEQRRSCLDFAKAQEELGWTPAYDIDRGIAETAAWFQDEKQK